MKIKRQKQAKKTISFYKYNFNFREPFQILIDGTFCQAALKNKIQIKEQLPKYLMGEVQLCTTKWVRLFILRTVIISPSHIFCCCYPVVHWKNWSHWGKSCMGPKSSCRGTNWGGVRTWRALSPLQSACSHCWRRQTHTTTLLLHR